MAYMEIAVGLRRKACIEPSAILTGAQVIVNLFFHKAQALWFLIFEGCVFF